MTWAVTDDQNTIRDWLSLNPSTGVTSVVDHADYDAYGNRSIPTPSTRSSATPGGLRIPKPAYSTMNSGGSRGRWYDPDDRPLVQPGPRSSSTAIRATCIVMWRTARQTGRTQTDW